jgi:hypothetical protein
MSDLDLRDWTVSLTFSVPTGDEEGIFTEALLEAALQHAPSQAAGMAARADTAQGKVWIAFTLVESSRGLADEISKSMRHRVAEAVLSGDDACVTAG